MSENLYPPPSDHDATPPAQPSQPPPPAAMPPAAGAVSYAPTVAPTEPLAIWALICAIGSWVLLPVVLAIVALVMANRADEAITAAAGWKQGQGMVSAARVIAWIHLVLVALIIVFVLALLVGLAVGS